MALNELDLVLRAGLDELRARGTHKGTEHVITGIKPPAAGRGPRYYLAGQGEREFLRMNSNSYLEFSRHPEVIKAEEAAARALGAGPGAVRFISGTYQPHIDLEKRLARFHDRPAAMIFNAAYSAVMGVLPQLITPETMVISDELNHNSIINGIRLARPAGKLIYQHLDMADLQEKLAGCVGRAQRLLVVTDGIFSMRGDYAPLDEISTLCREQEKHFRQGIITVMDDSHGIGACGLSGRGVEELTGAKADILVATLGKGLGVNGGYVAASGTLIDYFRQTSPFYIYSNPITPAEAAAARKALDLLDCDQGRQRLAGLQDLATRFRRGLTDLGLESLDNPHPIVPLLTRDTARTAALVNHLFANNILATGLNYPVVPKGDEEIRFQINAGHTNQDIDSVLAILADFPD